MKKQLLAMALGLTFAVAANAADAQYRLVIHGGAGNITADRFTPEQQAEYHAGLQKALLAGNKVLASGGTAIDAVKAAINEMELNPIFNAGSQMKVRTNLTLLSWTVRPLWQVPLLVLPILSTRLIVQTSFARSLLTL